MTIELDGASLQEGVMDGLTLLEVYVGAEKVWPTIDVHEVNVSGSGTVHLVQVSVPAGQTWAVHIEGTVTEAHSVGSWQPTFQIGSQVSSRYMKGSSVDLTGTITSTNPLIMMSASQTAAFSGTVTIEK